MIRPASLHHAPAMRAVTSVSLITLLLGACAGGDPGPVPEATYGLGRAPTAAELVAIDRDVDPMGRGLPAGSGTAASGAGVYAAKCASCHGANGEGVAPVPAIVGRTPDAGYNFALEGRAPRTIGNYWPYATTVFDYVRRAMPLNAPGSLSDEETYQVTAWLLARNRIIGEGDTLTAATLPAVRMPARRYFVPDNRTGGPIFR